MTLSMAPGRRLLWRPAAHIHPIVMMGLACWSAKQPGHFLRGFSVLWTRGKPIGNCAPMGSLCDLIHYRFEDSS
jgi:hypothetical protein